MALGFALGEYLARLERDGGLKLRHLLEIQSLPYGAVYKKHPGVGVVDYMLGIVRIEVGKNRNDCGAVGYCPDKHNYPGGGVFTQESHMVAGLQAYLSVEEVQTGYTAGEVGVGHHFRAAVVGKGGEIPVVAETILVYFQDMVVVSHFKSGLDNAG